MKIPLKIFLLSIAILMVGNVSSNNHLDSLNNYVSITKDDTLKMSALLELTENCPVNDIDKYAIPLIELTEKFMGTSKNKKSLKLYKAQAHNNLGFMHKKQGSINDALENFYISVRLSEEIHDSIGIANTYSNIASTINQQGDRAKAIDLFNKSLKIYIAVGDEEGEGIIYNNLGQLYEDNGNYEESIVYYMKSDQLWERLDLPRYKGYALNNIGVNLDALGLKDSALSNFNTALKLFEEGNHREDIAWTYNLIGRLYLERKEYSPAEQVLKQGYDLSVELKIIDTRMNISQDLYHLYQVKRDFKQAYHFFKIYNNLNDSIKNEETQKVAIQQQAKYEYDKQKAIDDAQHEKQIAVEQEAKEKQRILTYATTGGLGLVGVFLFFVFNRLKITKRQKEIIEEAHEELEERNQEILDSINYAKRIQSAILPPHKVVKEYLKQSFIFYKPKDIVAGDFYWLEHKDDGVLFAAADCTGHGVPGAMVSVVCNNGLNRSVREYKLTDPGQILNKTREIVVQEFEKSEEEVKDGMDIALCSLEGNILQYAGAHNPLWIIRSGSNEIEEIKADKQPIGQTDNPQPYTTHKVELQKGDTIYIFSDGYADQFGGEKGKKMKTANFKKLLLSIRKDDMNKQKESIDNAFEQWKGGLEQLDDVCVIGVRI